jgi:hypothetical protein
MPAHRIVSHARVVSVEEQSPGDPPTRPSARPPWWSVAGAVVLAVALYVGLPRLVGGFDDV